MTTMEDTVPLSLLAAEWGTTTEALISQLGPDQPLTDDLGIRHIRRRDAARLLEQRQASEARKREADARHRAGIAAQLEPTRARVAALKERAAQFHRDGHSDMSAFEMMAAADKAADLDGYASRRMDALLRGESGGYRLTPTPTKE